MILAAIWRRWTVDYRARQALAPLLEFLNGKSIAIVGNATSLLDHSYGALIDEHEVVTRMNAGFPTTPAAQGRRFDLWCFSDYRVVFKAPAGFAPPRSVSMSPKFAKGKAEFDYYSYPRPCWRALRDQLGARPSVGAMTIDLIARAAPRQVTIIGFDFKRTGTYYQPVEHRGPHDFSAEERFVADLVARRSWRFVAT